MPDARSDAERVGPPPAPPPDRLDTWTVMDLLATARRWRVKDPFVGGQIDGISRALVACVNAARPIPHWLRAAVVTLLLETLWERQRPSPAQVDALVRRWRERPA